MEKFDYLIVGSGLFGATFAHRANKAGKKCLVIDKRTSIARTSRVSTSINTAPIFSIRAINKYGIS